MGGWVGWGGRGGWGIQPCVLASLFKWNFKSIECQRVGKVEESLNYN